MKRYSRCIGCHIAPLDTKKGDSTDGLWCFSCLAALRKLLIKVKYDRS